MRPVIRTPAVVLSLALALAAPCVFASEPSHPWVVPAPRLVKTAYFSNLADGARIETPFLLKFGVTGIGIAPIVKPVKGTGHHHLLVNRELPLDFSQPLPFNDQYIHFGKGQMETVLTFEPGAYSLRLVMADEKHIPNFVYSKPINITVAKKNAGVDPKSLVVKGVAVLEPAAGSSVKLPFRIALHASGLNVSNTEINAPGTGHFRLRIKPERGREEVISLSNGFTEVWLRPPAGNYSTRVEFIDNATPDKVLAASEPVSFRAQD